MPRRFLLNVGSGSPRSLSEQPSLTTTPSRSTLALRRSEFSQRAHAGGAAPELKVHLADLTKKVIEADDKIREAAKPQKLHFEIVASK